MNTSPQAVFAGKTSEAYITTLQLPILGYMVQVPHPTDGGKFFRKAFRKVNGDLEALLKAAVIWRDAIYQQHYGQSIPHRVFHKKQANSVTGIPGVRKTVKTVKKKRVDGTIAEYKVPCLIAEIWVEPGKDGKKAQKSRSKIYSLNKYKEEVALLLAAHWRQEQEMLLTQVRAG